MQYYKVSCRNCSSGSCETFVDTITVNKLSDCTGVDCSAAGVFSIGDIGLTTLSYTDDTLVTSFSFKQPVTNHECCDMIFSGPYTDTTSSVIDSELTLTHDSSGATITIAVSTGNEAARKTRNFYIKAQLGTGGPTEWVSYGGSSMF